MRFFFIVVISMSIFSCKQKKTSAKENDCILKEINVAYINKYLVIIDSCKTFNGFSNFKYYNNDKLLMSGFSEKNDKQGQWTFFDSKEKECLKGNFKDSQPLGTWNFKDLGELDWELYQDFDKEYYVSYPSDWKFIEWKKNNSIVIFDKMVNSDLTKYNFRFLLTSLLIDDIEGSIKSLYEESISNFKKNQVQNLNYKKIEMDDKENEFYEIQYNILNDGIKYTNNEFMFTLGGRLYIKSVSIKKDSEYDYKIIKEILNSSFKIIKD
jgi:hypothetical protein